MPNAIWRWIIGGILGMAGWLYVQSELSEDRTIESLAEADRIQAGTNASLLTMQKVILDDFDKLEAETDGRFKALDNRQRELKDELHESVRSLERQIAQD